MSSTSDPSGMVDWDLAVRIGSRLAGEGPQVERAEAQAAVEELRAGADRSTGLVREFTGLAAAERTAPVLVVDRAGWVQANADGFRQVLGPVVDQLTEKKAAQRRWPAPSGSRVTGAEVGGLLGFLGGKVLGQFDPFHPPAGRLLLVAPNIVHVERELDVDPHDFRLWVCLHEETHRVQFTAVPWMRDHMFAQVGELADVVDAGSLPRRRPGPGDRGAAQRHQGRQPARRARQPRAEGAARPDHRRDVAARGPRRRRHGRRRARA